MLFFRLLPVIISFLLLGAHFSRDGQPILGIVAIVFPFLLFIKEVWVRRLFQIALILAALEWLRSLYFYIESYELIGKSWNKVLIIMGSVALFTALSGLVFRLKSVKKKYS